MFFAFMVKIVQIILSDYVSGVKGAESDSIIKNFFFSQKGLNKKGGERSWKFRVECWQTKHCVFAHSGFFTIGKPLFFSHSVTLCRRCRKARNRGYAQVFVRGLDDNAVICF